MKRLDIYGQAINLTYKGDLNFKTTPGAVMTILVFLMLLAYTTFRAVILLNKINPEISKKGMIRNLETTEAINPFDFGFDFAFGLSQPLDPSYGSYIAQQAIYYYNKTEDGTFVKVKESIDLEIEKCGNNFRF